MEEAAQKQALENSKITYSANPKLEIQGLIENS